jgi:8-oxo-dGTP diphosphatase
MIDWLWRIAIWIGFRVLRLWWRLRRPNHHGVLVAIWCNGRILTVRQSYRLNASFPGGGINRGEDPRDAARRELAEELGLLVSATDLILVLDTIVEWDFRNDHIRFFELDLRVEPQLRIDNREIKEAQFINPQALLADPSISPAIRAYLQQKTNDKSATGDDCRDGS